MDIEIGYKEIFKNRERSCIRQSSFSLGVHVFVGIS